MAATTLSCTTEKLSSVPKLGQKTMRPKSVKGLPQVTGPDLDNLFERAQQLEIRPAKLP
ncbi:MAG: hypothetical protein AAF408_13080 [Pseudomonadota bacterium]